ncbi:MAG: molecular chaperone TorD family protein [Deltaproteobacteria bacterium]|nr:molecular chaperone TorD family protein [Deltaproteobacteria bacterium]
MSNVKSIPEIVLQEKMKSDCYRFLSACFCQPQMNLFQEEHLLTHLTITLREISPGTAVFSAAMEEMIRKYSDEDLTVEYTRLFLGPFEIKAPPYGSLYLDGEKKVMGDSTMEVIRFYEEAGLSRNKDCMDLPDHIAVELEFMSYLTYREAEALEKSDFTTALEMAKKQERFLDQFLGQWIREFCEKIKESSDNGFYLALADCASSFVGSHNPGHLRETLGEEDFRAS